MRKIRNYIYIGIFVIASVLFATAAFYVVRTNSQNMEQIIYKSSIANISEVYTQVKNNFDVVTNEQWKMLELSADYVEEAKGNDADIVNYVKKWNDEWLFTKFFFLNANGDYYASDGEKGIVDLGSAWKSLFKKGEKIVIDGSIPGREAMLFFAIPCKTGTFKGFEFSAIAIAYDMDSLNRELGVNAFEEKSNCYIVGPSGRVILKNESADDVGGNILFHLKESTFTEEELDGLRASFEQQESGSFKYKCNACDGHEYYMFYTPVGVQDWELVACIESNMVDESTTEVQKSLIVMLAILFWVFAFILIGLILLFYRRTVQEKNQKIWQQNILFSQMSEHMNDMFILYNTKANKAEYISLNVERILGIPQKEAENSNAGIATVLEHPEEMAQLAEKIEQLAPGESFESPLVLINRKTTMHYNYIVSAIREEELPELVSIIFSDRTKEIESRRQIEDALMVAEHANKAKTSFLNNMSHDIRTPMNAIIGFTSLATSHIGDTRLVEDYLRKIMVSSEHLLSLINDVLDMSRIESGKVKIEEKETALPIIMHDLRNILQTDIKAKRLEFYIDTVDIVHEGIICDKLRLNQILINLMSNAMKFTEPGGTVGVRVIEYAGAPEGYADYEFRVKDTGIGMNEDFIEHIFEPFTREETSTVSKIQGTGLGMAITKNIVDMMGGTITVNSKVGEGTEFIVSLRFETTESKQEIKTIKNLEGFRALVADDSMDSCSSVTTMLRQIGMRPEWTTSGKEAVYRSSLAVKEGDPFKAYIIDWLMPDMNGIEVVRRIRQEIGNDTPIIILTAYDWSSIEAEAREAGVTAFCAKPLFLSELYNILQNEGKIPEAEIAAEIDTKAFKGKRVILADDVEFNREIAVELFEEVGIEVDAVENGKEAVELLAKSQPGYYSLIFMDIMMPVMNGYEATRAIRALDNAELANIPIIATTANAFEEDIKEALQAGMNEHLAKPFKINKFYETIKRYIESANS